MKETGLILKAPMVLSILEGRKTQMRRVLKNQRAYDLDKAPLGQPGDRIYVRETWAQMELQPDGHCPIAYMATDDGSAIIDGRWKPSSHMPKWAARIWLEVIGVRVERLQDISEEDALAEGVFKKLGSSPVGDDVETATRDRLIYSAPTQAREAFARFWESAGGDWDANPGVWVVDFKVLSTTGKP